MGNLHNGKELVRSDIIKLLKKLDRDFVNKFGIPHNKYIAHIVGGAAIVLQGFDQKKTTDIDIVDKLCCADS